MSEPLLIERGSLLNFSGGGFWAPHPHRLELAWYSTAEHRFQAMKTLFNVNQDLRFHNHDWINVDAADSPRLAKKYGRRLEIDVAAWDEFAPRAMLEALLLKFTQNPGAWSDLKLTGDRPLVEHRPDPIWGDNLDGSGKNLMGLALEYVRSVLCR